MQKSILNNYQICFKASKDKHEKIKEISKKLGIPITLIGKTTYSKGLILYDESHNEMALGAGYKHF